jgi:hypothetical protein
MRWHNCPVTKATRASSRYWFTARLAGTYREKHTPCVGRPRGTSAGLSGRSQPASLPRHAVRKLSAPPRARRARPTRRSRCRPRQHRPETAGVGSWLPLPGHEQIRRDAVVGIALVAQLAAQQTRFERHSSSSTCTSSATRLAGFGKGPITRSRAVTMRRRRISQSAGVFAWRLFPSFEITRSKS